MVGTKCKIEKSFDVKQHFEVSLAWLSMEHWSGSEGIAIPNSLLVSAYHQPVRLGRDTRVCGCGQVCIYGLLWFLPH